MTAQVIHDFHGIAKFLYLFNIVVSSSICVCCASSAMCVVVAAMFFFIRRIIRFKCYLSYLFIYLLWYLISFPLHNEKKKKQYKYCAKVSNQHFLFSLNTYILQLYYRTPSSCMNIEGLSCTSTVRVLLATFVGQSGLLASSFLAHQAIVTVSRRVVLFLSLM